MAAEDIERKEMVEQFMKYHNFGVRAHRRSSCQAILACMFLDQLSLSSRRLESNRLPLHSSHDKVELTEIRARRNKCSGHNQVEAVEIMCDQVKNRKIESASGHVSLRTASQG